MAEQQPNFVHTLLRARDYQDRPQFDLLCDWWRLGGQGVCALVGIGGAGKTAVVDRFLRVLPEAMAEDVNLPKDESLALPERLFVFSFYDAPNPDEFIDELSNWLVGRSVDDRTTTYSYEHMLALLRSAGDCLLVLDGLEKIQDPGVRGGAYGRIVDGRLRDLVLRVAEGYLPLVAVIITTRFQLYDPMAEESPLFVSIPVEQLEEEAAIALLKRRGVRRGTDDQLRSMARDQGFHALSVDLVGGYIAEFCDGDPGRMPPDPLDKPAEERDDGLSPRLASIRKQERKFARLAERYQEALSQSDPAAIALLQRVCLFRLGVSAKTLASIFTGKGKEGVSGRELAKLSLKELGGKLQRLAAMRLIEVCGNEEGDEDSSFSIHPAVRDGFLKGLDDETARQGHNAAREGLETSLGGQPGRNPSDTTTLDLLEEIIHHTLEAGHTEESWEIYNSRIGNYENLGWRLGAYERGERICRMFVAGEPPQTAALPDGLSENDQAAFISEWGLYLCDLGRPNESAICYERYSEFRIGQESWEGASAGNQNLADVRLLAGHLTRGLGASEEALRLAERADDAASRAFGHAYRGHALALRGETDVALTDFHDALHWQHQAEGQKSRPLYGPRGTQHSLLLVRIGKYEVAKTLMEACKEICSEGWGPNNHFEPPCNLILADVARIQGDLSQARRHLAKAHEWAIARDAKEVLCWSALVRARIELSGARSAEQSQDAGVASGPHSGTYHAVREAVEDGLRIARDCGFGIYHIDLLLVRAQVALHEGRGAEAEGDLRLALEEGVHPDAESGMPELLAATDEECGYAWGIAEGRHLLAEALLLQAAQKIGQREYATARFKSLPDAAKELIKAAREQLSLCCDLRKRIQDAKLADSEKLLRDLDGGVLTEYPLEPSRVDAEESAELEDGAKPTEQAFEPESESVGKKHVFISYCHDNASEVAKLRKELLAAGEVVWWDEDIPPGQNWELAIKQAMKDAYAVLLCLSAEAEARSTAGIFPEARDAIEAYRKYAPGKDFLFPVRLSKCEIPLLKIDGVTMLDSLQYVDLFPAADRDAGVQRLVQAIQDTPYHP